MHGWTLLQLRRATRMISLLKVRHLGGGVLRVVYGVKNHKNKTGMLIYIHLEL
jgi:hypothetical protein